MIPVRLTLKNFMSYGEEGTTLDFTGLHVISLCGDNGNGKSALLDAITYALWGKTRASGSQSSAEDDLVRLGAEETDVTLEFRLGDDLYRSRRRRNRRTHSGDWQIFHQDPQGEWHPVGGTGSRETERKIVQLLRMDYETFLNSAYIQQGRADEFTRQKPDARKRILTEVLELQRYDRLEEMAKSRRDEANMLLKELEGEMRHLEVRVSELETWNKQLQEDEVHWAAARDSREKCEAIVRTLRERIAVLQERAELVRRVQMHLAELEREVAEIDGQMETVQSVVAQERAILLERDAIEADHQKFQQAQSDVERLQNAVERSVSLDRERQKTISDLALRRQELLSEIAAVRQEVRRLEEWEREIQGVARSIAEIAPQIELFEAAERERESARDSLSHLEERFTELRAQNKQISSDIEEIESVLLLLDRPKPACPVCSTDLTGGRQASVVARQRQRLSALRGRLDEVKAEGAEVKRERDRVRAHVESLDAKLRAEAALRARSLELSRRRDELAMRLEEAEDYRGRLACLEEQLATDAFGEKERAQLSEIEREIESLKTAVQNRQAAERTARELSAAGIEARMARLQDAERTLAEREAELRRLSASRTRKWKQAEVERGNAARHQDDARAFDVTRTELAEAEASLHLASEEEEGARARMNRARHALEDIGVAAEMLAARKKERDKVAKDAQAYGELVTAFGKRGVQAVIIESMLPEIEEEANRLLSRLTENAMQVALSTQRQARSGSHQIETLDIQITDDAGTRPYELYSGGEAFRVNFSLRIALSRLLARRSGARLQTLIIDEGFGSQDAKGRERLVEAIEAVKDEFALILVISHIDELKDAFPHRIEVTKTPEGSQLAFM